MNTGFGFIPIISRIMRVFNASGHFNQPKLICRQTILAILTVLTILAVLTVFPF